MDALWLQQPNQGELRGSNPELKIFAYCYPLSNKSVRFGKSRYKTIKLLAQRTDINSVHNNWVFKKASFTKKFILCADCKVRLSLYLWRFLFSRSNFFSKRCIIFSIEFCSPNLLPTRQILVPFFHNWISGFLIFFTCEDTGTKQKNDEARGRRAGDQSV